MTTEDALIRAVLDNPADDTPRLAYADYLDETPTAKRKARAEFIRLQIQIGDLYKSVNAWSRNPKSTPEEGGEAGRNLATAQIAERRYPEILKTWGCSWLPSESRPGRLSPYPHIAANRISTGPIGRGRTVSHEFNRGFVSCVRIACEGELNAEGCSRFLRSCLASQPIELIVFTLLFHEPEEVSVEVRRLKKGWRFIARETEAKLDNKKAIPRRAEFAKCVSDQFEKFVSRIKFTEQEIPF